MTAPQTFSSPGIPPTARPFISSEHYRQMLVRDGDRRFREWHGQFLAYQQQFLREMAQRRLDS